MRTRLDLSEPWGYATVSTPVGDATVAGPNGALGLCVLGDADEWIDGLALGPRPLDGVRRELDAYFAGTLRAFTTRLDWSLATEFQRRVLGALARVPYGQTVSYGELARLAGAGRAARAVGGAVGANPICIVVPCHRVLAAGGAIGGFGYGLTIKRSLLAVEGIEV